MNTESLIKEVHWKTPFIPRGLPLITYASRGGGGVNTDAYKCVQGGRGGSEHDQKYAFVRMFLILKMQQYLKH